MRRLLITGGTGFVGSCMLRLIAELRPEVEVVVSSRSTNLLSFGNHLLWDATQPAPLLDPVDTIIHAATSASAELNSNNPSEMYRANVRAMANVIELAQRFREPPTILFTSSGAVYGEMPRGVERFPEGYNGMASFIGPGSAYAEGKRDAELLLADATQRGLCVGVVARLFAFSGIGLPLNRHFAIGNFVRDAIQRRSIIITGDGTPVRSYLDGRDLAQWILRAVECEAPYFPYHFGSEEDISIRDLADLVAGRAAEVLGVGVAVRILGEFRSTDGVSRYVPETSLTRQWLGVSQSVSLSDSVDQMLAYAAGRDEGRRGR